MNFNNTLTKHLEAMSNKQFETFMSTVCADRITLIMPNGTLISKYEDFYELHKQWFSDSDWSIDYTILNTIESSGLSSALLSIDYKDLDENGKPVSMTYYLNLMFEEIQNEWLLIHDQNTIYKK